MHAFPSLDTESDSEGAESDIDFEESSTLASESNSESSESDIESTDDSELEDLAKPLEEVQLDADPSPAYSAGMDLRIFGCKQLFLTFTWAGGVCVWNCIVII